MKKSPKGRTDARQAPDEDLQETPRQEEAEEANEARANEERSPLAAVAETIGAGAGAVAGTIGAGAGAVAGTIGAGAGAVAGTIGAGAGAVAETIGAGAGAVISGARRIIGSRGGARVRAVRRMGHEPLPNLWDLHPEARRAAIRELGVRSVSVGDIAGTAVEGPNQRGGDFLPLPDRRSDDWRSRWQRILRANERLEALPPVELIKFGDSYWVVDGHNRVAAALYTGQDEVDAVVQELRLPGMKAEPPALIAPLLEDSLALRDAGAGRHNPTVDRPISRLPIRSRDGDGE